MDTCLVKFVDEQANIGYGSTVSVSDNGEYITVGAPKFSRDYNNPRRCVCLPNVNGVFQLSQTLTGSKGSIQMKNLFQTQFTIMID